MMASESPRSSPSLRRPTAKARTSSRMCAQVQVCQMPKSLWRIAGRLACALALRSSSFGTVSRLAELSRLTDQVSSLGRHGGRPRAPASLGLVAGLQDARWLALLLPAHPAHDNDLYNSP